ncbi:MAG: HAMP domain-containing sensor histidine kinase [Pseudomonadota bacterium]
MKRFLESLTLLQLILLGFAAVILPLALAISIAIVRSEEFAANSRKALVSVQSSTDTSRLLAGRVRELERSARQYFALEDAEILTLYQGHRSEVLELLAALRAMPADIASASILGEISIAEDDLRKLVDAFSTRLHRSTAASPGDAGEETQARPIAVAEANSRPTVSDPAGESAPTPALALETVFEQLRGKSTGLIAHYSQRGRELSNELPREVSRLRNSLVLLAVMVIPLSLLLAAVFLVLARRPLRQLDGSIRTLGDGVLSEPIQIGGARDLMELGQRLDWLRTRLSELEGQKMRFLREVSHELKTPLTNIREASALLLDDSSKLEGREAATVIRILHENGLRLQTLIEELLRFGATDSGGAEHQPLALHELVSETVRRQAIAAQARSLDLHTELSPVCVRGNPRQIDIVVDNLLSNAIKFAPERGQVDVTLKRCGTEAQLDVIDDGPGVPEEHRDNIFEWFFRGGGDDHAVVAGSGMGLAIANEYARMHAGTLQLLPSERGAFFRLSLSAVENTTENLPPNGLERVG